MRKPTVILKKNVILLLVFFCVTAFASQDQSLALSKQGKVPALSNNPEMDCRITNTAYPEWVPAEGAIIAWDFYNDYFVQLTRQLLLSGKCWILVDNFEQRHFTERLLNQNNIPLDKIVFLTFPMDDIWVADYCPIFTDTDGHLTMIDNHYFRSLDDQFPEKLEMIWGVPRIKSELEFEGGNFMTDGLGTGFVSTEVYDQNMDKFSPNQVNDRLKSLLGIHTVYALKKLQDGTGHVDMFAKLLDEDTLVIGQYSPNSPEYDILEANAKMASTMVSSNGKPYEILRIPMPGNYWDYWTYTNALIYNNRVLVPQYQSKYDQFALTFYQNHMPGYEIVPIDCREPISSGGAVHCTVKLIPRSGATQERPAVPTVENTVPQISLVSSTSQEKIRMVQMDLLLSSTEYNDGKTFSISVKSQGNHPIHNGILFVTAKVEESYYSLPGLTRSIVSTPINTDGIKPLEVTFEKMIWPTEWSSAHSINWFAVILDSGSQKPISNICEVPVTIQSTIKNQK